MNTELFFLMYDLVSRSFWLQRVVFFIAEHLDGIIIVFTVLVMIIIFIHDKDWKQRKWIDWIKEVATIGISTAGALFITILIKHIVKQPRPFVVLDRVSALVIESPYTSFPSGHATFFYALAMAVYGYHKKLGYLFFFLAGVISLSRIGAGVHYPVDIMGGMIIGISFSYLSSIFLKKNK